MRLLLDTVTFLWATSSPAQLSRRAMSALRSGSAVREISAISLAEIALKSSRGKLTFGPDEINAGITALRLRVLPYTSAHALGLFHLPLHHGDPFDRQIISQALTESIQVVTPDKSFNLYEGLEVIW
jgi:PIN domain nuclease of toxin-antitoxin system